MLINFTIIIMPGKKKKYNARFPPARIKKIMQTDEDVGKVAAPVPVIISKALELFVESLLLKASANTQAKNARTLTPQHLKQTILSEARFDFLKDLVANISDVRDPSADGEDSNSNAGSESKTFKPLKRRQRRRRKLETVEHANNEANSKMEDGGSESNSELDIDMRSSEEDVEEEEEDDDDEEEATQEKNHTSKELDRCLLYPKAPQCVPSASKADFPPHSSTLEPLDLSSHSSTNCWFPPYYPQVSTVLPQSSQQPVFYMPDGTQHLPQNPLTKPSWYKPADSTRHSQLLKDTKQTVTEDDDYDV